jgi:hypothetical protein
MDSTESQLQGILRYSSTEESEVAKAFTALYRCRWSQVDWNWRLTKEYPAPGNPREQW